MSNNGRDTASKALSVFLLSLLLALTVYFVFDAMGSGFNLTPHGSGANINTLIVSILVLAVKLLWLIFIISLVMGLFMLVKKHLYEQKKIPLDSGSKIQDGYTCPCCGTLLAVDFKFCPKCKASLKDICDRCGRELQVGWNSCPWCGKARTQ